MKTKIKSIATLAKNNIAFALSHHPQSWFLHYTLFIYCSFADICFKKT